ncbi:MAG: rhodanese-like domain-containing protein [Pseudomonadota bacterium]
MSLKEHVKNRFLLFLILTLLSSTSVARINMGIPDNVTVVAAPQVREMMENKSYVLINSLSDIEFNIQHIPGSINIPVDEMIDNPLHYPPLPDNKEIPLIFYCMGSRCPYSRIAAKEAVKRKYQHVFWFRGGIAEWRKYQYSMIQDRSIIDIKIKKLTPDKVIKIIESEDIFILDVRPKWFSQEIEDIFSNGYVIGTNASIPMVDLHARINELPNNRPILVTDGVMFQSINTGKYLKQQGYNVIGVLKGGIVRWAKEKKPMIETLQD